jgi:hypothetical protein
MVNYLWKEVQAELAQSPIAIYTGAKFQGLSTPFDEIAAAGKNRHRNDGRDDGRCFYLSFPFGCTKSLK